MKNIYIVPALFLLTLSTAYAADGDILLDVSGPRGSNGQNGQNAEIPRSDRARDGQSGGDALSGANAGLIEATIGFVEGSDGKEVYIKGTRKNRDDDNAGPFSMKVPTASLRSLRFLANGGTGGDGGTGGSGERGDNGKRGTDRNLFNNFFGINLDGERGGDGQTGGFAGTGGTAGRGGDAGTIKIKLAPGAELLAPMIQIEAKPGNPGSPGSPGNGGTGGGPGKGGRGICEDGTLPDNLFGFNSREKEYTNNEGKVIKRVTCGVDGSDGRTGQNGADGNRGKENTAGRSGSATFLYADGQPVKGRYKLSARNWLLDQSHSDGVIEPKEDLTINGLAIQNTGDASVPAANYVLEMAGGKQVTVHMDELAPGAVREVKLETPVKLEAPAAGSTNIPASLRLNALAPGMDAPPAVSVEQPVALTQTSDLQLTSRVREGQLVFNVYNRSNKSYGAEGELGRDVKIQLNPTGANAPLVEVAGEFQPLTKQLELPIAKLAPGETQQIRLNVKAPTGWKPGQEFSIETRLSIKDSKVAPVRGRSSAIAYKIDVNDGLNKQFSVQNLGVTCQYDHALWFNYEVKDIQITKPENADYVDVKVKLKGDKESPVYKIAVSEIPKGFLENVLKERNFTSYELRDFLQGLGLPLKKPASWNISSCYAEKDFSSNSDPARFAALEAGKLGHSSEQLNETSASVMQGHSAQKSLSSSNYTQTAELRNSEDSVNAR